MSPALVVASTEVESWPSAPSLDADRRELEKAVREARGNLERWTVEAATALLSGDPVEWVHRALRRGTGAPA